LSCDVMIICSSHFFPSSHFFSSSHFLLRFCCRRFCMPPNLSCLPALSVMSCLDENRIFTQDAMKPMPLSETQQRGGVYVAAHLVAQIPMLVQHWCSTARLGSPFSSFSTLLLPPDSGPPPTPCARWIILIVLKTL
jgi:hypothetical protein